MSEQNNGREEPEDPNGILNEPVMPVLDAMMVQLNEVYESLKRAGFTAPEAITMVTGLLSHMVQYNSMMGDDQDDEDSQRRDRQDDHRNDEEDDNDDWDLPEDFS